MFRQKPFAGTFPVLLISLSLLSMAIPSQMPSREYQVKAVFLYNFSQFVEWPKKTFPGKDSPLVIGVLGKDPFGEYLDETVREEKINGHPLVIRRFATIEDVTTCHILFINADSRAELKTMLENLKSRSILTVGDSEDFAREGGMIGFFTKKGKTGMQVNLDAAKNSGLTISSKLLRLAELVHTRQ